MRMSRKSMGLSIVMLVIASLIGSVHADTFSGSASCTDRNGAIFTVTLVVTTGTATSISATWSWPNLYEGACDPFSGYTCVTAGVCYITFCPSSPPCHSTASITVSNYAGEASTFNCAITYTPSYYMCSMTDSTTFTAINTWYNVQGSATYSDHYGVAAGLIWNSPTVTVSSLVYAGYSSGGGGGCGRGCYKT